MGLPHPPEPSILFIAILYSKKEITEKVLPLLHRRFGDILTESPEYKWDHSSYYASELGSPLFRRFIFYKDKFDPLDLPGIKLETNSIEIEFSVDNKRLINIDPGYLMASRVVLASAKDYSHRIYLGQGIYGELELFYQANRYNPLPYTYYDYREPRCLEIFEEARKKMRRLMKHVI